MFDVEVRDGAARLATWKHKSGVELALPLLVWPDTTRFPAPRDAALVLAERRPASGAPWIQDLGSRFSPRTRDASALLALPSDLPYSPAAGPEMLAAADDANRAAWTPGDAWVMTKADARPPSEAEWVSVGSLRAVIENPYTFAAHVAKARDAAGYARVLHAPGGALPSELALLAYVGFDAFDATAAILAASRGVLATPEGDFPASSEELDRAALIARNAAELRDELGRVKRAIRLGRLRELVEMRVRARPELAAHLRRFDKDQYAFLEERAPIHRDDRLFATSKESLERPEIERWLRRVEARYRKPESARVLLILPCSARKPYSESKTHRILDHTLERTPNRAAIHEVILTSPLGVVPRELERAYPAAHYDLPVTGHWDEDEKAMIRGGLAALVGRNAYDRIIVHLEEAEQEIAAAVLPPFESTAVGDPLAPKSLENLARATADAARSVPEVRWGVRTVDDLAAIARWQFGERAGTALAAGATARGKWPWVKLMGPVAREARASDSNQLAMLVEDRGILSLTFEGGERILEAEAYCVEIGDFALKGSVFAAGVEGADPDVRVGDDVVLVHRGALKGVGRALMSGREMVEMQRGVAVAVRHHA
ncbi:MAG: archaeosine synthase subunit alpha [Thermoplasmatota archaeon]